MDQHDHIVEVAGAPIHYSVTGNGDTAVVLTHGFRAHHVWWAKVVPLLAEKYTVVTLDLSGSGDSGHRDDYGIDIWGQEVNAVLDDAGIDKALMVGHSLGGTSVVMAATQAPERALGVIAMDTFIQGEGRMRPIGAAAASPVRYYETKEDAVGRFRLMPPQEGDDPALLERLAHYGVKAVDERWTWKFDQVVAPQIDEERLNASIAALQVPFHYVHAMESPVVVPEVVTFILSFAPEGTSVTYVPEAKHHLTVSHPEICAEVIDRFAQEWSAAR